MGCGSSPASEGLPPALRTCLSSQQPCKSLPPIGQSICLSNINLT